MSICEEYGAFNRKRFFFFFFFFFFFYPTQLERSKMSHFKYASTIA